MKPPYSSRLMLALPGHEPIEYARFGSKGPCPKGMAAILRDLSPEWMHWMEHTTRNRDTITARPGTVRRPIASEPLAALEWPPHPEAGQ